MILLNPKKHNRRYPDERSRQIMIKTIAFLENKGLKKIKKDYHEKVWNYDFVEFLRKEKIFAILMTPKGYGAEDSRWDTYRHCEFAEITFEGTIYDEPIAGEITTEGWSGSRATPSIVN